MEIKNKRLSDDEFAKVRQEVLGQWSTGRDVNFEEGVAFHKSLPEHKIFSKKLNAAKEKKITLICLELGLLL